ncbi:MAG: C4-dicarboxylate ABC transporter permease [Deltaproteobacteria bacterium RBG_13_53_10]|nr:MAG: C4-dicarboxylate ABC transporter permease [Deltaproteobacteria bacterium RBG_13_53_10]
MDWYLAAILILGSLIVFLLCGMPVAFSFLTVCILGTFIFLGGIKGLPHLVLSMQDSVKSFSLIAVPLFVFMGEILLHSRIGFQALNVIDEILGQLPGRLSLVAVAGGTMFAALSGSSMANVALLGTVLAPEMERRGYSKEMSLGPILGGGALALVIPPSSISILLGSIAKISVAKLLIGGIVPGLIISSFYVIYIIVRCWLNPALAPSYEHPPRPLWQRVASVTRHVLPLSVIFFFAVVIIFFGFATPSEAAATAALSSLALAAFYRRLNLEVLRKALDGTVRVTVLFFIILSCSLSLSQILAFSGASRGLVQAVVSLSLSPLLIIIMMQVVVLILGCFIDMMSIMMVCLPLYMPIVHNLGIDPIWFGLITLLSIEVGGLTPPFGLNLFVMKGVASAGTTMKQIYIAAIPFVLLQLASIALFFLFPMIMTWLPAFVR